MKVDGYMVIYDDGDSVFSVYGWADDCEGALQVGEPFVLFADRKAAQRAIRISSAKARLDRERGVPANDDFLPPFRKNVRIVPVVGAGKDGE